MTGFNFKSHILDRYPLKTSQCKALILLLLSGIPLTLYFFDDTKTRLDYFRENLLVKGKRSRALRFW